MAPATKDTKASPQIAEACRDLQASLPPALVSLPGQAQYKRECKHYWSRALRTMRPACIVSPASSADVAAAVKILAKYPDVPIAIRSGGHDPNPGHASTDGGVLLSLTGMKGATYDKESGLARVKPGGMWNDVLRDLEPHGVTIVGGRLGTVGVGGYLLQGGLSFLAAQYGLGADSVVGWKVVTGDGSIVQVDAQKQPELAVAMRGSGSQFGVVTEFQVKTYPIGTVWGGARIFSASKRDALLAALHKFAPHEDEDPKAAVIYSDCIYGADGFKPIYVFLFYDGPTPPTTGPFAELMKIPCLSDQCAKQTYPQLLYKNGRGADIFPYRWSFRSLTIPYIPSRPGMYREIVDKLQALNKQHSRPMRRQVSVTFQPFPKIIGKRSAERGGNAMGLGNDCIDRIIIENSNGWYSEKDDELLRQISRDFMGWIEAQVPRWLEEAGMPLDGYMPDFMNDAAADQKVMASYRGYEEFKKLQESFDTTGMFRRQVGGHKY